MRAAAGAVAAGKFGAVGVVRSGVVRMPASQNSSREHARVRLAAQRLRGGRPEIAISARSSMGRFPIRSHPAMISRTGPPPWAMGTGRPLGAGGHISRDMREALWPGRRSISNFSTSIEVHRIGATRRRASTGRTVMPNPCARDARASRAGHRVRRSQSLAAPWVTPPAAVGSYDVVKSWPPDSSRRAGTIPPRNACARNLRESPAGDDLQ
jgi:hypothetical protein